MASTLSDDNAACDAAMARCGLIPAEAARVIIRDGMLRLRAAVLRLRDAGYDDPQEPGA